MAISYSPDSMDEAAELAEQELNKLPKEAVDVISAWWSSNYLAAGHKRLGRILVRRANNGGTGKVELHVATNSEGQE